MRVIVFRISFICVLHLSIGSKLMMASAPGSKGS